MRASFAAAAVVGSVLSASGTARAGQSAELAVGLDVVATDARGRTAASLKPADFDVREDGAPQSVSDVRFLGEEPRIVAVFVDEYHLTSDAADRVRTALANFIDRDLQPRDLLVVMKPLDSLFTIRLSTDRDAA